MRFLFVRHGETVHNLDARMQGNTAHTPLTRLGIAQAEAVGSVLAATLACGRDFHIWCSPAGRTLQTAAIIAEHLGRSFFDIHVDPRLREMEVGAWEGRRYEDIVAADGEIVCPRRRIFTVTPPGGETYADVADRLSDWLTGLYDSTDILAISHGITLRVLHGLLCGGEPIDGVLVGDAVPQGSTLQVRDGVAKMLVTSSPVVSPTRPGF